MTHLRNRFGLALALVLALAGGTVRPAAAEPLQAGSWQLVASQPWCTNRP